jgi:hypothetical protein
MVRYGLILRVAGFLSTLWVGIGAANTLTYNFPGDFTGQYGYSAPAWPSGSPNAAGTVAIRGFNTALGTLTKVTLTAIGEAYGTYFVQNEDLDEGATINNYKAIISMAIYKTTASTPYSTGQMPGINSSALTNSNVFITLRPLLFDINDVPVAAASNLGLQTFGTLPSPSTDTQTVDLCAATGCVAGNNQPLSQFYGSGIINLPVFANVRSTNDIEGGNVTAQITSSARITVSSITYEYTPNAVPEPGTVGLLISGGAALFFVRRRRQA